MEPALDETLEDAEFLQVDGINDSAFERPGKVEVVTSEEAEREKDGSSGWVLVGQKTDDPRQVQHKARKEVETRWPNMVKFYGGDDTGVDLIMRRGWRRTWKSRRDIYRDILLAHNIDVLRHTVVLLLSIAKEN